MILQRKPTGFYAENVFQMVSWESQGVQPWASPRFWFRGTLFVVGAVGGPGGGRSTPDAGEFSKICKKFLKQIAKNALF